MNIHKLTYLRPAWLVGVLFILNASLAVSPVYAAKTIHFTGTLGVIEVDSGSNEYSGLSVGDSFSGSITYGNSALDADFVDVISPTETAYGFIGIPYGGFITGGSIVIAEETSEVHISDNDSMGDDAEFINNLYGAGSTTEDTIADSWGVANDTSAPGFGVLLYSLDTSLYSGTDFQALPPALADSDFALFYLEEEDEDDNLLYLATGILTSITVVPDTAPACGTILTSDTTLDSDMLCAGTALILSGAGSDNVMLDCAGHSITSIGFRALSVSSTDGITIKNCLISSSSERGIVLDRVTNSEIKDNTIVITDSRGIDIRKSSNNNLISNNDIHTTGAGSYRWAVHIRGGANNNQLVDNLFETDSEAVKIESSSGNELAGNTMISPDSYLSQGKLLLQSGGITIDSAGNMYAVENSWSSSSGLGTTTVLFQVNKVTGLAHSAVPLVVEGFDVGLGFDALEVLPNGRFFAFPGFGNATSTLYEIDPVSGEVTGVPLNGLVPDGKPNGLEAISNSTLLATTNAGELLSIDLDTNTMTLVGQDGNGWTDLANHPSNGKTYAVSRWRFENTLTAHLYDINPNTGEIIEKIGDTGGFLSGIEFAVDGTLYGNDGSLRTIDITDGTGQTVGADLFGPDPFEPISENNRLQNNVFQTGDGSIRFTDVTLPSEPDTELSTEKVKISTNEARVDSTALPFLDAPARITLTGLTGSIRSLLVDPEDDGSFVPCLSPQCTLVSFTGGELIFDVTGFTTYSSISNPVPDITANGSGGPLLIPFGTPLQVDVSLASNDATGQAADWWLVIEAPDGRYWYDLNGSWVKSVSPIPTYGGALFDITSMTVLNSSNLPIESYRIYFGVDTNANGVLDFDVLFVDTVDVTIQ